MRVINIFWGSGSKLSGAGGVKFVMNFNANNMKQIVQPILHMLTLLLVTLLLTAGCTKKREPAELLFSEFKKVDKLVLARMSVSKMATIDDLKLSEAGTAKEAGAALIDALKIGNRKAAYSYNTYLRAYVDMSEFTPDDIYVDDDTRVIEVRLPAIQTEFAGRDAAIKEEHYRVTGLRSSISPYERADIKERMNAALKKEVENNPEFSRRLTAAARLKGSAFFSKLADIDGYSVSVSFKNKEGGAL